MVHNKCSTVLYIDIHIYICNGIGMVIILIYHSFYVDSLLRVGFCFLFCFVCFFYVGTWFTFLFASSRSAHSVSSKLLLNWLEGDW